MPIFLPTIAFFITLVPPASQLHFDFDTSRKIELHHGVHRLGVGVMDVDQPLMSAAFELFAAVLVLVDCAKDGDDLLLRGERDRAGDTGTGALCGLYDPFRGLVDQFVLVALQLDADCLVGHAFTSLNRSRMRPVWPTAGAGSSALESVARLSGWSMIITRLAWRQLTTSSLNRQQQYYI